MYITPSFMSHLRCEVCRLHLVQMMCELFDAVIKTVAQEGRSFRERTSEDERGEKCQHEIRCLKNDSFINCSFDNGTLFPGGKQG